MMTDKRRDLLKLGAFGCAITLAGRVRSDAGEPSIAKARPVSPTVWDPSPWLVFAATRHPVRVDLSQTLPSGVSRGGTFSLASTSRSLPSGVSLSTQGVLTLVDPIAGITSNIIFAYAEPAA